MECLVFSLFQMRIRLKQKTETNNTAKVNKSRIVQNRNYCQWIKINPENYNFHSLTFTGHFFYNSFKHLTFLFPRFFVVQISREPQAKKGHKGSVCIVLYMQSKKVTTTSTTRPWSHGVRNRKYCRAMQSFWTHSLFLAVEKISLLRVPNRNRFNRPREAVFCYFFVGFM